MSFQKQPGDEKVVDIVAGGAHVCARMASGRVKCWGDNSYGQCNLKAARNVSGKYYDVSRARFSQITAGLFFTCGILQEDNFAGVPVCFGANKAYLDVPNEKIKEIVAGRSHTCFAKDSDPEFGCVGTLVDILKKTRSLFDIAAKDLPKHGIDASNEELDYSKMSLANLKTDYGKVCGQAADGKVYCMGSNIGGTGEPIPEKVLDYAVFDNAMGFITEKGEMKTKGLGFVALVNLAKPDRLRYKKYVALGAGMLTAAGNLYDDGTPIPEDTVIYNLGQPENNVLAAALVFSSNSKERIEIKCTLMSNHKILCAPREWKKHSPEVATTLIIKDLPKELAY